MSQTRAFTLVEVLIVIGMITILGGGALLVSMETYRGSTFRFDRDLLIAALQRARAQAINNECSGACHDGEAHGVYIDATNNQYILFQGATYATRDAAFDTTFQSSLAVTHAGLTTIVFSQLTGNATSGVISLVGQGKTSDITIGQNGQITWTN